MQKIKFYSALLFIIGWLFPKISIFNFNIGVQEVAALFLILSNSDFDRRLLFFFLPDILFVFTFFILGSFYFVKGDIDSFLIAARTLLFTISVFCISGFSLQNLSKLLKLVIRANILFLIISFIRISYNFYYKPFDLINFLYGSDMNRIRSLFEPEGAASSTVPIGYMLSLFLFLYPSFLKKSNFFLFIFGILGTASRSGILSIIIALLKKIKFTRITFVIPIVAITFFLYIIFLKSSLSNNGELDGSASKRLILYNQAFSSLLNDPVSSMFGFGISDKLLSKATGEGFYESFIVNSLMQGGVLFLLMSILILIKTIYYSYRHNLMPLCYVVLIANILGGSNYFSMYAYPTMSLIFTLFLKIKNNIKNEENSSYFSFK